MVKISTIFGLGVFIILVRYSGLPIDWKNFFYVVSGLFVAILSVLIRRELLAVLKHVHTENDSTETFAESTPAQQDNSAQ